MGNSEKTVSKTIEKLQVQSSNQKLNIKRYSNPRRSNINTLQGLIMDFGNIMNDSIKQLRLLVENLSDHVINKPLFDHRQALSITNLNSSP